MDELDVLVIGGAMLFCAPRWLLGNTPLKCWCSSVPRKAREAEGQMKLVRFAEGRVGVLQDGCIYDATAALARCKC